MKLGFNRGEQGMEKVCNDTSSMTKKDRIRDFESSIKCNADRLKSSKKEMKALAFLKGGYSYNSEYINLMIGQCFIEITEAKNRRRELKKRVKQLKKKKDNNAN